MASMLKENIECRQLPNFSSELPRSVRQFLEDLAECVDTCACLVWICTKEFVDRWDEDSVRSDSEICFRKCVKDVFDAFHAKFRTFGEIAENRVFPIRYGISGKCLTKISKWAGSTEAPDGARLTEEQIAKAIKKKAIGMYCTFLLEYYYC